MKILRTPESRFATLRDYPFTAHYHQLTSELRLHYVDEGPRDAPPVLMLHGEPTWSYLYRHMIPPVAQAGLRVLAPDLVGFGKSDKPASRSDYSYAGQVAWIRRWLEALDLRDVSLVCQDWGSLIGLRLVAELPDRFARVLLSNGGLPTGTGFSRAFRAWRAFSRYSPWFPIGRIVQSGTKRRLSADEIAAYDAPFPSGKYKAGARIFPSLVPVEPDNVACSDNRRAWDVLEHWHRAVHLLLQRLATRSPAGSTLSSGDGSRGRGTSLMWPCAAATSCRKTTAAAFARLIISACRRR